jgi:hypothetical protein
MLISFGRKKEIDAIPQFIPWLISIFYLFNFFIVIMWH